MQDTLMTKAHSVSARPMQTLDTNSRAALSGWAVKERTRQGPEELRVLTRPKSHRNRRVPGQAGSAESQSWTASLRPSTPKSTDAY